jgi:hypothetical protein
MGVVVARLEFRDTAASRLRCPFDARVAVLVATPDSVARGVP